MANHKLFEEAVAEAKAIREAAIANAKDALEESLTPHLKDMLAAKLQEMDSDEDLDEAKHDDEEMDEAKDHEEMDEAKHDDDEMNEAEDDAEESEDEAEEEAEEGEEAEEIEDMNVDDLKDLIRDIIAQEMGGGEDLEGEEGMEDLGMDDEEGGVEDMVSADDEEINLEELLAELEALSEEDHDDMDEAKHDKDMDEAKHDDEMEEGKYKDKETMEEELEENAELNEALSTIEVLRKELSEVNLLNSKLLYVNKIFKAHNLSEAQKVNIITTFDKAETVKEVKLVYETVAENIGTSKSKKTQIKEHKSFASKAAGNSTKGEVISEVSDQVRRMQKLAGIIK